MAGRTAVAKALTKEEREFCDLLAAMDFVQWNECFRRAWPAIAKGRDSRDLNKLAKAAMRRPLIARYLGELRRAKSMSDGEAAREALSETVREGAPTTRIRASEKILKNEDELGFRDAAREYARILCEVGAVVDVPLPQTARGAVSCPECLHDFEVELPVRAEVPVSALFPSLVEANP